MNLPNPPGAYDTGDQAQTRRTLEQEDIRNMKIGNVFDKIMLRDTVTGTIATITVASGAIVVS